MVDPSKVALFIPGNLKKFKLDLFQRIGRHIASFGGRVIHSDFEMVRKLPDHVIPIIGCAPEFLSSIEEWQARGRKWIYWDRGYARRVFATWLPRGTDGGFYRWHVGSYQMTRIMDVPSDRWDALKTEVKPWAKNPNGHIHIAAGSPTYDRFHGLDDWVTRTTIELRNHTDRKIVVSDKETKTPLSERIAGAHALVSHGSNAATEAVIMGCPVFVHSDSAAALVGLTDLSRIEAPIYPERQPWLNSLAYSQWNETELTDGTLFRMLS